MWEKGEGLFSTVFRLLCAVEQGHSSQSIKTLSSVKEDTPKGILTYFKAFFVCISTDFA